MKSANLLLLVIMLASAIVPAADANENNEFTMECAKPIYIPRNSRAGLISALLNKGVAGVIRADETKEHGGIPEGGVALAGFRTDIERPLDKYFGPFQWQEYKCAVEVLIVENRGGEFIVVYLGKGDATANKITNDPHEEVDPCSPALHKALSAFSCRGPRAGKTENSGHD